ncbi:Hypothetical protein KNT65_gp206 [Escherichia phage EcS1]|uniref:Uncharacterized protein n=1 Tax=Escherichia phage EcS1 TaxID=2083276 RepID=A0A2Z5ZCS6_9CAUD|nr:Hypothetical protein KNT65_gp206 [Escherichia phage EcS1]BBC78287.1 Hypothetical protein [Escherichia phage EcS1]
MTLEHLEQLRGLIYESEVRATIYGRHLERQQSCDSHKMASILEAHTLRYHENWGRASKELQDFIKSLVKE